MAKLRILLSAAAFLAIPVAALANPSHGNHCNHDRDRGGNQGVPSCSRPDTPDPVRTPDIRPSTQQPSGTGVRPPTEHPVTVTIVPEPPKVMTGQGQIAGVPGPDVTGIGLPPVVLVPIQPPVITGTAPIPPLQTVVSPPLTGERPTIILRPLPPTTVTGVSPVIQGVQGPGYTGTGPMPTTLTPGPQTTGTGLSPVFQGVQGGSITGSQTPVILTPNPPDTVTGLSPAIQGVQGGRITGSQTPLILTPNPPDTITGVSGPLGVPGPGFTGSQPMIIVYANPPRRFEGYGRVPASVIIVPPMVPQAVPPMVPQATPPMGPTSQPPTVTVIAPPKSIGHPRVSTSAGGSVSHQADVGKPAVGPSLVTNATGRQVLHDAPRFITESGEDWHCLASGHGPRRSMIDGEIRQNGALRHVGSVDVLGRDLPALHPGHADCIISVRRARTP